MQPNDTNPETRRRRNERVQNESDGMTSGRRFFFFSHSNREDSGRREGSERWWVSRANDEKRRIQKRGGDGTRGCKVEGENESIISATQCAAATSHSLTRGRALHDDMKRILRRVLRKDLDYFIGQLLQFDSEIGDVRAQEQNAISESFRRFY